MAPGGNITAELYEHFKARSGQAPLATHRPGKLLVVGARPHRQTQALRQVQGERCAAWNVLVFVAGLDKPIELSVAEARNAAAQLLELADAIEGKRW